MAGTTHFSSLCLEKMQDSAGKFNRPPRVRQLFSLWSLVHDKKKLQLSTLRSLMTRTPDFIRIGSVSDTLETHKSGADLCRICPATMGLRLALAVAAALALAAPAWGSGHGHGHKRRTGALLNRMRRTTSQQVSRRARVGSVRLRSAEASCARPTCAPAWCTANTYVCARPPVSSRKWRCRRRKRGASRAP